MVAIQGFGGGLDVQSIVSQIMYTEQAPVRTLQASETKYNSQASAFRDLKSKLSTLETAASNLTSLDATSAKSASTSDSTVLTATSAGDAIVGRYSIDVQKLASTNTFVSGAFNAETDSVGNLGETLTLSVGGTEKIITLTAGNRSLAGLRDAINDAGLGVSATIITSGSHYKLALFSKESGRDGAITISNNLSGISFAQTAAAQNAVIEVNGIAISSSSNSSLTVLQGITLNVFKEGTAEITIAPDSSKVASSINQFIDAFNNLNTFFTSQFTFDTNTKSSGILAADATVRGLQDELQRSVTQTIYGLPDSMNSLSAVGISFNKDGSLSLDSTKLESALSSDANGVADLFRVSASFTDSRATFVYSNEKTKSGTYAIDNVSWTDGVVSGSIGGTAGTGVNKVLFGAIGSNAEGLSLGIDPGATGSLGNVTVSVGFGELIRRVADQATYYQTGSIDLALSSIDNNVKDIQDNIDSLQARLAQKQELVTKQLIDADTALKEMQNKMNSLSSQLSSLK